MTVLHDEIDLSGECKIRVCSSNEWLGITTRDKTISIMAITKSGSVAKISSYTHSLPIADFIMLDNGNLIIRSSSNILTLINNLGKPIGSESCFRGSTSEFIKMCTFEGIVILCFASNQETTPLRNTDVEIVFIDQDLRRMLSRRFALCTSSITKSLNLEQYSGSVLNLCASGERSNLYSFNVSLDRSDIQIISGVQIEGECKSMTYLEGTGVWITDDRGRVTQLK